jgi:hypothetical protein
MRLIRHPYKEEQNYGAAYFNLYVLDGKQKTRDSKPNGSKHSLNLIFPSSLYE